MVKYYLGVESLNSNGNALDIEGYSGTFTGEIEIELTGNTVMDVYNAYYLAFSNMLNSYTDNETVKVDIKYAVKKLEEVDDNVHVIIFTAPCFELYIRKNEEEDL